MSLVGESALATAVTLPAVAIASGPPPMLLMPAAIGALLVTATLRVRGRDGQRGGAARQRAKGTGAARTRERQPTGAAPPASLSAPRGPPPAASGIARLAPAAAQL